MDDNAVIEERERLESILDKADIPSQQRNALAPVIDNMAWQRVKLDETREMMKTAQVVCKYNNGGGQSGIRQNPIFKGYLELWRGYMLGLEKFTSVLPPDLQDEVAGDITMLEKVKKMKQKGTA